MLNSSTQSSPFIHSLTHSQKFARDGIPVGGATFDTPSNKPSGSNPTSGGASGGGGGFNAAKGGGGGGGVSVGGFTSSGD